VAWEAHARRVGGERQRRDDIDLIANRNVMMASPRLNCCVTFRSAAI
jgi:hypothetical protein